MNSTGQGWTATKWVGILLLVLVGGYLAIAGGGKFEEDAGGVGLLASEESPVQESIAVPQAPSGRGDVAIEGELASDLDQTRTVDESLRLARRYFEAGLTYAREADERPGNLGLARDYLQKAEYELSRLPPERRPEWRSQVRPKLLDIQSRLVAR